MAFLQSAPPPQPFFRAPPVVPWLIAALAVAHGARVWAPPPRALALVFQYGLVPARYSRAFLESRMLNPGPIWEQVLPFVSYMGLHNDWTHLTINCLWLLAFGPIVARRFGTMLFLTFFIVCGVVGGLVYLAFNWGSEIPVVGASGAISGLMGAAVRMLPGQVPWAQPGEAPLAPLFSRQILVFTAVWLAVNLAAGLTGLGLGTEAVAVAWQAHLGGFAAGLLLAGAFDGLRPRATGLPLDS
ncbi:MAG: glpG [Alphaproteobacteria bacterium]|nr:glpG [Alphaproteobacteria bacterium]MDB5740141.1 glpG [Alphaproteobacteria bacterium]